MSIYLKSLRNQVYLLLIYNCVAVRMSWCYLHRCLLGVELLNGNKVGKMCTIMKNIHEHTPKAVHPILYEGEEAAVEFFNESYLEETN